MTQFNRGNTWDILDDFLSSLSFRKIEENLYQKEDTEVIDELRIGFESQDGLIRGAVMMQRKIKAVDKYWEGYEKYLCSTEPKFLPTIFSDPVDKKGRRKFNLFFTENNFTEEEIEKKITTFFKEVISKHLIPDLDAKSDLNEINSSLNNPVQKRVTGPDWIRKIIVSKMVGDTRHAEIFEFVKDHFQKFCDKGHDKSCKYLEVIKIVLQRLSSI